MDRDELIARRDAIVAADGPWTAHDIDLGQGVSTLDKGLWQQWRVEYFSRLLRDAGCDAAQCRILDLACLEGLFAIEFARMGAETIGLEIREVHLRKAEFARATIGLSNCRFVQGDVRSIPAELGDFDVILCAGILYHLDFPDSIRFLRQIAKRCKRAIVVDSHFAYSHIPQSLGPMQGLTFEGHTYRGRVFVEHAEDVTAADKQAKHLWASIDNNVSVWFTEESVKDELKRAGFDFVSRSIPAIVESPETCDRPTLVFKRVR